MFWPSRLALQPLLCLALIEASVSFASPFLAALIRIRNDAYSLEQHIGVMWPRATAFAILVILSFVALGLYSARQRARPAGILNRLILAMVIAGAVTMLLFHVAPSLFLERDILGISIITAFTGCGAVRVTASRLHHENIFKRRVLVYGTGQSAASMARLRRRSDRRRFEVVGFLRSAGCTSTPQGARILEPDRPLVEYCRHLRIDEIVVAMDDRRQQFPVHDLLECRLAGIHVRELVSFLERESGKVVVASLCPSWMIFSEGFRRDRLHKLIKRGFDVVGSLLLLIVTAPLMLIAMVAICLECHGRHPLLYRQVRVGLNGQPFEVLKFRSMRPDAEADGVARWAQKNDARVTRVGAIMRKTRIDELPQIFNVLRGDMSLVGPRPERPEFVAALSPTIPYYLARHSVKPGITGWAQICYQYAASEHDALEKLQFDLYYVKHQSLVLDLLILVETVEVILMGKGWR